MEKNKLIIILFAVLLALLAFLAIIEGVQIGVLNKELDGNNASQVGSKNENENKLPYESVYSFYILDMQVNDKRDYKINDDYTISFEITGMETQPVEEYNTVRLVTSYNLYINDKFITNDTLFDALNTELQMVMWNGYILYQNYGITDIRNGSTFFIDKNGDIVKEIRELDEKDKGLVAVETWRYSNRITVVGSRVSRGYSIVSQGNTGDVISVNSLRTIPKDTAVEARYTYTLNEDGTINFDNPEIFIVQTFRQYLKQQKSNIISLLRADSTYEEGTLEGFINE